MERCPEALQAAGICPECRFVEEDCTCPEFAKPLNPALLAVHRKRAKQVLKKRITKRLPYPLYCEVAELIATFKVESGDQPMKIQIL